MPIWPLLETAIREAAGSWPLRVKESYGGRVPRTVSMRCPGCRHEAVLSPLDGATADASFLATNDRRADVGLRVCPRCRTAVAVFTNDRGEVIQSLPRETLDFDASDLPRRVVGALEEAVICHAAGCYTAAGMMVRKTLEVVCDEQGAAGPSLKARIESLRDKVMIPRVLIDGLDEIRLLGNDAAHAAVRDFPDVSREDVEISIAITKELLKSLYQYEGLVSKLQARRAGAGGDGGDMATPAPPPAPSSNPRR
ncbi:MAG TPA: DUF4145 domain-containing protein [Acidimicrobiales bacterium]|nr:DUF4145 domain-containing protein [Acidimicrobiales bacterium]